MYITYHYTFFPPYLIFLKLLYSLRTERKLLKGTFIPLNINAEYISL